MEAIAENKDHSVFLMLSGSNSMINFKLSSVEH